MKAARWYKNDKPKRPSTGRYLKRYFEKRTCRDGYILWDECFDEEIRPINQIEAKIIKDFVRSKSKLVASKKLGEK